MPDGIACGWNSLLGFRSDARHVGAKRLSRRVLGHLRYRLRAALVACCRRYGDAEVAAVEPDGLSELDLGGVAVFVRTCHPFFPPARPFAWFRPVEEVESAVAKVTASFGPNTVGVHVRRTDHAVAVERSPLGLFLEAMDDEAGQSPDVAFFLATDCEQTEEAVRRRFGGIVLTYPKRSRDRGTPEGVLDAMVDLLCLSRTRRMVGSCGSSFSGTAALLGGIPLVTVGGTAGSRAP
jgi:hypothetical protein